jgi:hypothetical protein
MRPLLLVVALLASIPVISRGQDTLSEEDRRKSVAAFVEQCTKYKEQLEQRVESEKDTIEKLKKKNAFETALARKRLAAFQSTLSSLKQNPPYFLLAPLSSKSLSGDTVRFPLDDPFTFPFNNAASLSAEGAVRWPFKDARSLMIEGTVLQSFGRQMLIEKKVSTDNGKTQKPQITLIDFAKGGAKKGEKIDLRGVFRVTEVSLAADPKTDWPTFTVYQVRVKPSELPFK